MFGVMMMSVMSRVTICIVVFLSFVVRKMVLRILRRRPRATPDLLCV
jgi:hypothetical protein